NEHSNVAKFRAALEKKISTAKEEGGLGVPTVCILIGGDARSLQYLEHSALIELPVLVYEGTGRAADVLCYAYRRYKE
uniref:TRPM SLOG domain-containing protein n=1 Tax=Romanomermis culicivorax TaxID=13658 RepID=A0A915KX92_ROMCU